ncbi:cholesterol 7-desaturase-like [Acanthaster planci]|uniref:cholesterol 7-desaturase n=1 Tax=Acanthaster planci TaxID=133434 RepID=A0A8B7Y520_ACAPL|nr:cholesterol 7-desaturase-like [Acanthaster planci]
MALSKAGVFTLVFPVFLAGLVIRPPILEDYAKKLIDQVQRVNLTISAEVVPNTLAAVVDSPMFRFAVVYGLVAVTTYLALGVYKALREPLAIYCDEPKVAYFVEGVAEGKTKEEQVREFKRWRRVGDVPPVYPNGWMSVLMSSELKRKEHKFVHVAGKNLAVFRGESGNAYIVDAYCAHLGANLAVGGSVQGECIECPFHGWRYRGSDGKCVKIGYAEKVPDFAKIPTYHSCEVNQRIFFWNHAEGKEPDWQIPELKEVTNGEMYPVGFTVAEYDGHNEDVPENGADVAHLNYLHGPRGFTGRDTFTDATWEAHETEKHIASVYITSHQAKLFGFIPVPTDRLRVDQIGPCFAHFQLNHGMVGRMVFVLSVTPIGPMRQRIVTTAFYQGSRLAFYIGKRVLYEQYYQIEGDIPVWANKVYLRNAMLVKEDHLIAKHRRFYAQFYSENSPKYTQEARSVDW